MRQRPSKKPIRCGVHSIQPRSRAFLQHLQGRATVKLSQMHVNQRLNKIMADLYGTQEALLQEQGLAERR